MRICLPGKIVVVLDFLSLKSRPMGSHLGNYGVWACAKIVKSDDTTLSHLHGSIQLERSPTGKSLCHSQTLLLLSLSLLLLFMRKVRFAYWCFSRCQ